MTIVTVLLQVSPAPPKRRGYDSPTTNAAVANSPVPKLNLGGISAASADGISDVAREQALKAMFRKLDLDRSGVLTKSELMIMSQARRFLGLTGDGKFPTPEGDWDDEKNERLLSKMDTNRDGVVDEAEFLDYFGNHWFGGMNVMSDQHFQAAQDMFMQIGAEAAIMHAEEIVGSSASREGSRASTPRVSESRTQRLQSAFEALDPSHRGYITSEEIFTLCQIRRKLSGKPELSLIHI